MSYTSLKKILLKKAMLLNQTANIGIFLHIALTLPRHNLDSNLMLYTTVIDS